MKLPTCAIPEPMSPPPITDISLIAFLEAVELIRRFVIVWVNAMFNCKIEIVLLFVNRYFQMVGEKYSTRKIRAAGVGVNLGLAQMLISNQFLFLLFLSTKSACSLQKKTTSVWNLIGLVACLLLSYLTNNLYIRIKLWMVWPLKSPNWIYIWVWSTTICRQNSNQTDRLL